MRGSSGQADAAVKCLVFTRTRISCRLLALALEEQGLQGVRYIVGSNDGRNAGGASFGADS